MCGNISVRGGGARGGAGGAAGDMKAFYPCSNEEPEQTPGHRKCPLSRTDAKVLVLTPNNVSFIIISSAPRTGHIIRAAVRPVRLSQEPVRTSALMDEEVLLLNPQSSSSSSTEILGSSVVPLLPFLCYYLFTRDNNVQFLQASIFRGLC